MIVQASTEKLGNLCFQLMMTGYMFRNAEYVLALKALMNLQGGATLQDFRHAFDKIDADRNGFLERSEILAMFSEVYDGKPPAFEVETFLTFFDQNDDGRISWEEFEKGFGNIAEDKSGRQALSLPVGSTEEDDISFGEPTLSGIISVELRGKVIEVDAEEYMADLKQQAIVLKRELAQEKGLNMSEMGSEQGVEMGNPFIDLASPSPDGAGGIASYINSLQGDVQSLTKGISPEVVESMKKLIDFVLDGGPAGGSTSNKSTDNQVELPGSALTQLALWQLVIGYRLRETEATGEWRQMLD